MNDDDLTWDEMKHALAGVNLLAAVDAWCRGHAEPLRTSGVEMTFGHTAGDRPKHGRSINARTAAGEADLIVWDTGEAESVTGRIGTANVYEHHQISNIAQLEELLRKLVDRVRMS
jgi:hypothetical protein